MDLPVSARRRSRRRRLVALILTLSVGTLGAGAFSLAIFTDTTAGDGTFTAGTIDIATNPATLFTVPAMMPGDTVSASLTVQNGGTGDLRFALSSASTNADGKDLRSQIDLTIKDEGSGCAAFDGATLYSGPLMNAGFGSNAQGADVGDRVLAAGATELLCFQASLPSATGNAVQGATTTTTFTFDAEQTANN